MGVQSQCWWLSTHPLLPSGQGHSGQYFVLVSFLFAEGFDSGEDTEQEFLGEQQED